MKKYMKRNQILITALAIMIAVAGYLSFQDKRGNGSSEVASDDVLSADGYTLDLSEEELSYMGYGNETEEVLSSGDEEVLSLGTEEAILSANFVEEDDSLLDEEGEDYLEPGEAVFTNSAAVSTLSGAKLLKEQTRAKNKETLLDIINNTSISEEAKQEAIQTMLDSTKNAEMEMAAEILLEAKGFQGAVVSIVDDSADVCVISQDLDDQKRAQVEDIVTRKTNVPPEKIVITSVW